MGLIYLVLMFILSVVNIAVLTIVFRNQKNNYIFYTFFSIIIANFGHMLLGFSESLEGAILANKVNYLGASFLPLFMFFALMQICRFKIFFVVRAFLVTLSFFVLFLSFTVGYSPVYYTSIEYVVQSGVGNYVATYGWGHTVFNVMMFGYVFADILIIVFAILKRKNVSYKNIVAMTLTEAISISSFLIARRMENDMLVMPFVYVCDQILILFICSNVKWYDVSYSVLESMKKDNSCAYVSFTSKNSFVGCNNIAQKYFPQLAGCRVDRPLSNSSDMGKLFNPWVDSLIKSDAFESISFEYDSRHYQCTVKILPLVRNKRLYLFRIEDDTQLQQYIESLGKSYSQLQKTVAENANFMHSMQEQMIVNMAKMVESRDNNTGGHIKRTSQVVQLLVEEMRQDKDLNLSSDFFDALVSAAPMHDLGKIAVDDQILRKPGRFTDEEFAMMKKHAKEGAVIVENLLAQIETPFFVKIAKNVAFFHHERWDGRGYPLGLVGADIPLEARIMAVADVFDALVSRRCYKERLSFANAYDIIVSGMGSQFDPSLLKYFVASFKKMKEYYCSVEH